MSAAKGARYERNLVNLLDEAGLGALRIPSSGSSTERDLPDILVGEPVKDPTRPELNGWGLSHLWFLELKSGGATTLYVDKREVEALERVASTWGGTPLLAARFTTQASPTHYYLVRPDDARETDTSFGLPEADIRERATRIVKSDGTVVET